MNPDPASPQNDRASDVPGIPQVTPKPRDMSQYIRTYAKDVARLTHQPMPAPATPALAPSDDDGVTLPEVDASPVNRTGGSARSFPEETLEVSSEDSSGTFASPDAGAPLPMPTQTTGPSDEDRKAEILARLRAKVASHQQEPPAEPVQSPPPPPQLEPLPPGPPANFDAYRMTPALASQPPQPDVARAPEAASEPLPPLDLEPLGPPANFDAYRITPPAEEQFPPLPPPPPMQATPPPPPAPVAPLPAQPEAATPGHTYTSDFADRIDSEHASTFQVLAAQQDAKPAAPVFKSRDKRPAVLPILLASVLILVGAGGLYAAYRFTHSTKPQVESLGVPSLISADEKVELQGPDYAQALADAANQPLVSGNILVTYVTDATTTSLGLRNVPQEGGVLIRLLRLGAPDILLRNVDMSSTVGVVSAGTETRPFFILRVNSFERTFAGMLGWEQRMPDDLGNFYPAYGTGLDTASTTAPVITGGDGQFADAVVANHDVRILRDAYGRSLMLYGYFDKQTLIIARNEDAFTALIARLSATRAP